EMTGSDEIVYMPVAELTARYRDRSLSPREVAAAVLARIDAHNEAVNAFRFVDRVGAIAAAEASEARYLKGAPLGPLDGVPASVKDHNLVTWNTDIELYILWDGEQDSTVATLKTQRQLIMDEVNKFRKLNATAGVLKALVVSGGDVEPFVSPDGATFWRQVLVCETQEDEEFTRSE
ncbi:hypothetical protein LCGC14_2795270, partial [marine sediment metagenome]